MINIEILHDGEALKIGNITLDTEYSPSCCEYNYADFNALKDTTFEDNVRQALKNKEITPKLISQYVEVCDYGFKLFGHFVPCYSDQNGYYSTELELHIGGKVVIDLDAEIKGW